MSISMKPSNQRFNMNNRKENGFKETVPSQIGIPKVKGKKIDSFAKRLQKLETIEKSYTISIFYTITSLFIHSLFWQIQM